MSPYRHPNCSFMVVSTSLILKDENQQKKLFDISSSHGYQSLKKPKLDL